MICKKWEKNQEVFEYVMNNAHLWIKKMSFFNICFITLQMSVLKLPSAI